MSGLRSDGSYELTATKALYWHRSRPCCSTLVDITAHHLAPAGFKFWTNDRFVRVHPREGEHFDSRGSLLYQVVVS